jgi:alpha-D-ribose 1-methylphosphonate 5-triphosphate synthase subunit PhnG
MKPYKPDIQKFIDAILETEMRVDRKILNILTEETMTVIREPESGLVMMSVKDSTGTDFHLGEVLVTEAEVAYQGCHGYAMITGNAPEKALVRAGIMAVFDSENEPLKRRLSKLLTPEVKKICTRRSREKALSATTRVNFETMTVW